MKWAYPEFLYALAFIAIPILIHLFNFRRFKKVAFTNVRFLREVKEETQSRSRLKHLLVLLMRILAIAFMVFAFAQPYIPGEGKAVAGQKAISFYLDNSFSMNAESADGRLFDIAKQSITDKVKDYKPTDQFQLITNDFEGRHQRMVNREEMLELLEEVEISPAVRNIDEVIVRQTDVLKKTEAASLQSFLFSDFQQSITEPGLLPRDTGVQVVFIPLQAQESNNLYIDSVWFTTPVRQLNQQEELNIRIVNTGSEPLNNIPINLYVNKQQKALGSFSIAADAKLDTVLNFTNTTSGIQKARLSLTDHPINFDDDYFFSYNIAEKIPVLLIQSNNIDTTTGNIAAIFRNDDFYAFEKTSDRNVDYARLPQFSLIVMNGLPEISSGLAQELQRFVENGGSLSIFPGKTIDINSYNNFFNQINTSAFTKKDTSTQKVVNINLEHPLYQNVFERLPDNIDLPIALQHYKVTQTIRSSQEALLRLQTGDPFLAQYNHGKGKVYVSAVALDPSYGNLARHAVYVTSLLRMAELSMPNDKLFYLIGRDEQVEISRQQSGGDQVYHIRNSENGTEFIAEHRNIAGKTNVFFHNQVQEAGNYDLIFNDEVTAGLGFNYQRKESDLTTFSPEALETMIREEGLTNYAVVEATLGSDGLDLKELDETRLWKWCILAVLLFLGLEVLLLRVMKG